MSSEASEPNTRLVTGEPAIFQIWYHTKVVEWQISPKAVRLTDPDTDWPDNFGRWEVHLLAETSVSRIEGREGASEIDNPGISSLGTNTRTLDQKPSEQLLTRLAREALDAFTIDCPDCDGTGDRLVREPDEDGHYVVVDFEWCESCEGQGKKTVDELRPENDQTNPVSVATIAKRFEIETSVVDEWIEKGPDFPDPVIESGFGQFYDLESVKAWYDYEQPGVGEWSVTGEPASFKIRYPTETVTWKIQPRSSELVDDNPDKASGLGRWEIQLDAVTMHIPEVDSGRTPHTEKHGSDARIIDAEPTQWLLDRLAEETLNAFAIRCPECDGTGEIRYPLDEEVYGRDSYFENCVRCNGRGLTTIGLLRRARWEGQIVSTATVAKLFRVKFRTVLYWKRVHDDFPEPVEDGRSGPHYDLELVRNWYDRVQPKRTPLF